jgi:hypothetical protein
MLNETGQRFCSNLLYGVIEVWVVCFCAMAAVIVFKKIGCNHNNIRFLMHFLHTWAHLPLPVLSRKNFEHPYAILLVGRAGRMLLS